MNKEEWIERFVAHMLKKGFDEGFARPLAEASHGQDWNDVDMTPEEAADEECYAAAT